jgi:hypothetical protein
MNYKKFGLEDVLKNTIKAYPQNSIFIDSTGSVFIKNLGQILSSDTKNSSLVLGSGLNLLGSTNYSLRYDLNTQFGNWTPVNTTQQNQYTNSQPTINNYLSSSVKIFSITSSNSSNFTDQTSITGIAQSIKLVSLKNTLDWYSSVTPSYTSSNYISSYKVDINNQISANVPKDILMVNIPSIFYGSSIKRGSVQLDFYITGTLIGRLQDYRYNGELVEVTGSSTGSTAGVILYDEGIILLTGSWNLNNSTKDNYVYYSGSTKTIDTDLPKWKHWGKSQLSSSLLNSSSFELDFQGTNYISSTTMLLHLAKNEANMTNNKTFVQHNQSNFKYVATSSNSYIENKEILIKNTIKTPYTNVSGSFKKQTFINKIGIYDENKKLIAIAKLATPVKKNNEREYTFKLKLDI